MSKAIFIASVVLFSAFSHADSSSQDDPTAQTSSSAIDKSLIGIEISLRNIYEPCDLSQAARNSDSLLSYQGSAFVASHSSLAWIDGGYPQTCVLYSIDNMVSPTPRMFFNSWYGGAKMKILNVSDDYSKIHYTATPADAWMSPLNVCQTRDYFIPTPELQGILGHLDYCDQQIKMSAKEKATADQERQKIIQKVNKLL